jgi:hypothetical protein
MAQATCLLVAVTALAAPCAALVTAPGLGVVRDGVLRGSFVSVCLLRGMPCRRTIRTAADSLCAARAGCCRTKFSVSDAAARVPLPRSTARRRRSVESQSVPGFHTQDLRTAHGAHATHAIRWLPRSLAGCCCCCCCCCCARGSPCNTNLPRAAFRTEHVGRLSVLRRR